MLHSPSETRINEGLQIIQDQLTASENLELKLRALHELCRDALPESSNKVPQLMADLTSYSKDQIDWLQRSTQSFLISAYATDGDERFHDLVEQERQGRPLLAQGSESGRGNPAEQWGS
jgi:hypothetical protein